MSDFNSRQPLKKDKMPLVLTGAGLLALIIFFSVVFPTDRKTKTDGHEGKPEQTEVRHSEFEEMNKRLARLEAQGESLRQLTDRLDRLEVSISSRMNPIEKTLEQLQKKQVISKPVRTTAPRSANAHEKKEVPEKRTTVRHHQVQAGETLYQISRTHGLSVEVLRRLNNLGPDATIHPGQKLVLTP